MVFNKRDCVVAGLLAALGLGVVFFADGCRKSHSDIRHIILVSIDTCRADHLSCYGFNRPTTPNIDALAAQSVLFRNAVSPVPLTLPSHSSMLTGTIPAYHGVHFNDERTLSDSSTTLAEVLKKEGYATGAIVSAHVLDAALGIAQGFDYYNDEYEEPNMSELARGRLAEEASKLACEWFSVHKDEPFFFFLHYYDLHHPYEPPEPYASEYSNDLYSGEIAYTDAHLGRVIAKLKELGIYDSALIIVTSDHGEMLGEHGEFHHGYFIYEGAIKVPLIVKRPDKKEHIEVVSFVGLVDIVPLVCSMLGIKAPSPVHGEDISKYWEMPDKKRNRYIYTESMVPTRAFAASLLGVVNGDYKYIQTTRPELYNTALDSREINNLVGIEPKRAHLLSENLKLILEKQVRSGDETGGAIVNEETRKKLETLGYVGSQTQASFDFNRSERDPKDELGFHLLQKEYKTCLVRKQLNKAKEVCLKMLAERPDILDTYNSLGELLYKLGQYDEALDYLTTFFALSLPEQNTQSGREAMIAAHDLAGMIYFKKRLYGKAAEHWSKAIAIHPEDAQLNGKLAMALLSQDEYERAVSYFERAIKLDPNRPDFHTGIAKAFVSLHKTEEAKQHLIESLKLKPDDPAAHRRIAWMYSQTGETREAIRHWNEALKLQPDSPEVLNELAWIKATDTNEQIADVNEAVRLSEKACELTEYNNAAYLDTLSACYAAAGRTGEAIEVGRKALQLARASNLQQLAEEIKSRLVELEKSVQKSN